MLKSPLLTCIAPHSEDEFFSQYWERLPLRVSRNDSRYFSHLISVAAFDSILADSALRHPSFRLIQDGKQISPMDYTRSDYSIGGSSLDGFIDLNRVYDLYHKGATIVLQALERSWRPLTGFCRGLELSTGHPVQANVYLTPKSSQGFHPHFDTHDVIALQVAGEKMWRIYDTPTPLPFKHHRDGYDSSLAGEHTEEFTMHPGDSLYLPRGLVHDANTTSSYSMHITIGIRVWTWYDVLRATTRAFLLAQREQVSMRRSLPPRFAQSFSVEDVPSDVREQLSKLTGTADPLDKLLDDVASRFVLGRSSAGRYRLQDLNSLDDVDETTLVYKHLDAQWRLSRSNERVILEFQDKQITMPDYAEPALRHICETPVFNVLSVPGLSHDGALTLVKRLILEGFLTLRTQEH